MKKNFLLSAVTAVVFTVVGAYVGNYHAHAEAVDHSAAQALFATSLPNLANQPQKLSQWKGKALLVNFWATWCAPCVREMPALSALQRESKNPAMQIIGIGVDSASNIQEFSTQYKISYPLYVAGTAGTDLLRTMGDQAGGLPFSILISPDGHIAKTYLGRLNMDEVKRDLAVYH
jgi:thiol-disulfide isomerase/thioredoxin